MKSELVRWHIVTGEYPPMPGGVSDYTHQIARGLAEAGDQVTVWAPETGGPNPQDYGVRVRRLFGRFGPRALSQLSKSLRREDLPFRLLVQYVPQMYGYRGMNLAFSFWLASLQRYQPWIMFHEVAYPWGRSYSARHNLLGLVQRFMVRLILRRSQRVFISIPGWEPMLHGLLPRGRQPEWLPIPSNLPVTSVPGARGRIRDFLIPQGHLLLGHFGTYGKSVVSLLTAIIPAILGAHENRRVLLIGRGSTPFTKELQRGQPHLADRILSADEQPADVAANYISACDLLIQPFPDGVSSRRGSIMAGLALGVPILTNRGHLTETIWEDGAVVLADSTSADAYSRIVEDLLASATELNRLACAGASLYRRCFALERTLTVLREPQPTWH